MAPNDNTFLSEYSKFLDSHGTHLSYTALSLYRNFNDELSEKERRFLKTHLDSCRSCSHKLKEVASVESDDTKILFSSTRWYSTPLYRYSLAAVLLFAVGVSVFYYANRGGGSTTPGVSDRTIAATTVDPERYVPNPMLESAVGRTVRSEYPFVFLVPRAGDTLAAPFELRWQGGKAGSTFAVIVVDNKNIEVWKGSTTAREQMIEKTLEPGLYYAKLEADGSLALVGKFVVVRRQQ